MAIVTAAIAADIARCAAADTRTDHNAMIFRGAMVQILQNFKADAAPTFSYQVLSAYHAAGAAATAALLTAMSALTPPNPYMSGVTVAARVVGPDTFLDFSK